MKLFGSFLVQSKIADCFQNENWKTAGRPKLYKRYIEELKYDFSGQKQIFKEKNQERIAPQRFSSVDFSEMKEDILYKIFPSTGKIL